MSFEGAIGISTGGSHNSILYRLLKPGGISKFTVDIRDMLSSSLWRSN